MKFKDFLTSRHVFNEQETDLVFKFRVLNYFMVIAVIFGFLIGFLGYQGLMKIGQIQPAADFVFAIFNIVLIWCLRLNKDLFVLIARLFVTSTLVLFIVALLSVETDEARIVWFYITVYAAYMLLGVNSGIVFTVISVISIATLNAIYQLQFSETAISTFLFALIVLSLLARAHARHIEGYENKLREQNVLLGENIKEMDQALVTAQSASQIKSLFLANMSHEIRTPMNGVLSMAQVLENTPLDEQQQGYLQSIKRSGDTLLVLIDDLLDLSKIESGTFELKPHVFNSWEIIEDIINQAESLFDDQSTNFSTDIVDNLPAYMSADAIRLKQVVVNLITNAAKFTPAGDVTLKIDGYPDADQFYLVIEVEDSGIGIPEEKLDSIFAAFQQLSTNRIANKGVGLGLAICKKIIEKMNGTISVRSEEGKGSCFKIELKLPVINIDPEQEKTPVMKIHDALRVLVFEDDKISRMAVTALLTGHGHKVVAVENGQEGIDVLQQQVFDVLLMDIHMPIMNGVDATRYIKKHGLTKAPVIGMTASVMNDEKESYFDAGLDALVEKPINFDALMEIISKKLSA